MLKRFLAFIVAIATTFTMAQSLVMAEETPYIKEYKHDFNNWSGSYYGYQGWRNGAGGSSMNTTHFANGMKYGALTKSVQFIGASGTLGYFDASKYADIALTDENKYFRLSFDIAADTTDAAVKIYNGNSGANYAQFFRIENGKMIFAMNSTSTVDLEAKRWYSVDVVECYENGAASWSAYVDGVKVFDGGVGFKFTKLDRVNVVKQSAKGADFSIDNVTFAVTNYEPEITADEIALASSDASNVKIQNAYPRLVSVKAGTTVAGLTDTLSGADSYEITDASSTVIEDTTAEATGNYLRVVSGSNTYIYPIDTWVIEPYSKEYNHDFNNWSGNYYGYYGWRNGAMGSSMNTTHFANGMKYGALTKSVQFIGASGTLGYFDASMYADIALTDENKYFRLSFDIAADTTDAAVKIYNGNSGNNNAQFFRIENGKMVFAMNTAKTVDLEAKRWYSVDIVESYENETASWSAYVDGVKVFDGGAGFKFTKLDRVNVVKQSAKGDDFSIDNVTFAVSNYAPEIITDEIELTTVDNTKFAIKNSFPRKIVVDSATKVSDISSLISNQGATIIYLDENSNALADDAVAFGNYMSVTYEGNTYIYPIGGFSIKDSFDNGSQKITSTLNSTKLGTLGFSKVGLYGKAADDLSFICTDATNNTQVNGESKWLVFKPESYGYTTTALPQTYSVELAINDDFAGSLAWVFKPQVGSTVGSTKFAVSLSAKNGVNFFDTENVCQILPDSWVKVDMVIYPADKKIDFYIDGEKKHTETFTGEGLLVPNAGTMRICASNISIGETAYWAVDNFTYYIGEPSYAQSDIPSAEFSGKLMFDANANALDEVVVEGTYQASDATAINGAEISSYVDSEGVTTVVATKNGIYKYYKITEIDGINLFVNGAETTTLSTGTVLATTTISRTSLSEYTPTLVLAVYEDGRLVNTIFDDIMSDKKLEASLEVEKSEKTTVKAMLWNGFGTIVPLTDTASAN